MADFVILTDSSADLPAELVEQLGVAVLPLSFTMGGKTRHNYPDNREMAPEDFYAALRGGQMATTAAVNVSDFTAVAEPHLQAGRDVLILAFSSALSATYQSAKIAAEELSEQYPDRKIYAVDTLCASLGQGLLVTWAAREQAAGKTIDEVKEYVEENRLRLCHWFTVDDLNFLKRGGRISAATALLGTMLSIKPVLHVDNEGRLISMGKARGRAAALKALVDQMEQSVVDADEVYISHGDCLADAEKVAEDVRSRFGTKRIIINHVGPVIGAHSGPGTVALFFRGEVR